MKRHETLIQKANFLLFVKQAKLLRLRVTVKVGNGFRFQNLTYQTHQNCSD